jgi:hypothetical protein
MKKKVKSKTPMEILTAGYRDFIKGKEVDPKGKELFKKAIKKAALPKPRAVK